MVFLRDKFQNFLFREHGVNYPEESMTVFRLKGLNKIYPLHQLVVFNGYFLLVHLAVPHQGIKGNVKPRPRSRGSYCSLI